ncbi:alcohol dehydrogenase [Salipaludibacillus keqinensis]|uniref:Alcohol dehydrogenase n=1 Tax=Salipaludibacillus keqinensis TaxID=2045207 RepID=A0A323TEH0_9BACI|nr:iron-containing alcohol dehydrogenase [Salipaludibacillus keqinensis]PYZ93006.1 alcohol dehydrogenase [Salipaludibacillus keqinensis]
MRSWEHFFSKRVVYGNGAIAKLPYLIDQFGANFVLIVTDQGIKETGALEKITKLLQGNRVSYVTFDDAKPEPNVELALECYRFAQSQQEVDLVIGLGGGSSIDLAKVVALLLSFHGHPSDYFGENLIPGPITPLIAVPTTAGSGSEVTTVAVLTDDENVKMSISDHFLRPSVALLDPELTLSLPPYVTACSGIDALCHAIEAYTAKSSTEMEIKEGAVFRGANPISDMIALEAIKLLSNHLTLAVLQGDNLEGRSKMLLGSMYAGMAFSNAGTAAAHALAYAINTEVERPHGEMTGILLPYVFRFNAKAIPQDKILKIAEAMGSDKTILNQHIATDVIVKALFDLLKRINLPSKLSAIGVGQSSIPDIAEKSKGIDRLMRNNPRTPSLKSLINLLKKAY